MTVQKLTIFSIQDIKTQGVSIKHQNAFIFPNGGFCLAQGYTGRNSSQLLESSALEISKNFISNDIKLFHKIHLKKLEEAGMSAEEIKKREFYYLKSILVHYYGYGLFARVQRMDTKRNVEQFWDYSMLPDPEYFKKEATESQATTMKALFELNNDGTVLPSLNGDTIKKSIQKILQKKITK